MCVVWGDFESIGGQFPQEQPLVVSIFFECMSDYLRSTVSIFQCTAGKFFLGLSTEPLVGDNILLFGGCILLAAMPLYSNWIRAKLRGQGGGQGR